MLGEYGDRQACLKRVVELKDLHRFSSAGTMIDGLNGTAHETAPRRRILNADRRGWVRIGDAAPALSGRRVGFTKRQASVDGTTAMVHVDR